MFTLVQVQKHEILLGWLAARDRPRKVLLAVIISHSVVVHASYFSILLRLVLLIQQLVIGLIDIEFSPNANELARMSEVIWQDREVRVMDALILLEKLEA